MQGGFTKSGPGDSQRRFPDLPFLLVVTTYQTIIIYFLYNPTFLVNSRIV